MGNYEILCGLRTEEGMFGWFGWAENGLSRALFEAKRSISVTFATRAIIIYSLVYASYAAQTWRVFTNKDLRQFGYIMESGLRSCSARFELQRTRRKLVATIFTRVLKLSIYNRLTAPKLVKNHIHLPNSARHRQWSSFKERNYNAYEMKLECTLGGTRVSSKETKVSSFGTEVLPTTIFCYPPPAHY